MNFLKKTISLMALVLLVSCSDEIQMQGAGVEETAEEDFERGPNNGRLLIERDFALELAIFETGVPPEFRAWATYQGDSVSPGQVDLTVTLTRLGNELNVISFGTQGEYLHGNVVVYEPHSFLVGIDAVHQGNRYHWEYESLEGRTEISPAMSQAFGIETEIAGAAEMEQTLDVIGVITANDEYSRHITARFDGLVQSVNARIGDSVRQGDPLISIESNESLNTYTIVAPISGVVTQRYINPGEESDGQVLLEIMDTSRVWAELAIYPSQRGQVQLDALVTIVSPVSDAVTQGQIDSFNMTVNANQSITARVSLDNSNGQFPPGTFIEGNIKVAEYTVPLAVKRTGLQAFRDFTVVYAKVGDEYEVRMLELGRQDSEWVEVLGGLEAGTVYVSTNSYILKADIEKSGASHDH